MSVILNVSLGFALPPPLHLPVNVGLADINPDCELHTRETFCREGSGLLLGRHIRTGLAQGWLWVLVYSTAAH